MSLICPSCHAPVDAVDRFVVYRNPADGFALYEYRCGSCGHGDIRGETAMIDQLLAAGARVIRLRRCDEPTYEDAEVADLLARLERDDWPEALFGGD